MACDFSLQTHQGIRDLQPYQPGKPAEEVERELGLSHTIKLASNENPFGISPSVKKVLQTALDCAELYPDASGYRLKHALASKFSLSVDRITLGNGSNELLDMIARVFVTAGDEVIYSQYGFLAYPIITQSLNAKKVEVPANDWGHDLPAMLTKVTDKTKLVFLANPNNPTGTYFSCAELTSFLNQLPPHVIVVLDEAYTEYVQLDDFPNGLKLVDQYPNLVVTRSFSKAYALAGLRVGYAYANEQITDLLNRVRQAFNVNALALAGAEVALFDDAALVKAVDNNAMQLQRVCEGLNNLGIDTIPSIGNFITFVCPDNDGLGLYNRLLVRGVIVRPLANYDMAHCLRVSIGTPEQNSMFLKVLSEELGS
ncbi:MAG: histidinol-phosphate transaminase [Pontibacterium sp.]